MGLDDSMSGHPDFAAALQNVSLGAFKIALFHSPAYFNVSAGRYDLALAGHSHSGQVRFPFIFPFWVPPGVGHYVAVPADAPELRRHWHKACWDRRQNAASKTSM